MDNIDSLSINKEERKLAMFAHLGALLGSFFPPGNIIIPLIIWLTQKDKSSFVDENGKEVLNFQISMLIWFAVSVFLCIFLIGIFFLLILPILSFILSLVGTIKANDGITYRYPLTIRFL